MSQNDILNRVNALLQSVALGGIALVNEKAGTWESIRISAMLLDASGVYQVEVEATTNSKPSYHLASLEMHDNLRHFWEASKILHTPCTGVVITVTPNGECDMRFTYK